MIATLKFMLLLLKIQENIYSMGTEIFEFGQDRPKKLAFESFNLCTEIMARMHISPLGCLIEN